MNSLWNYFWPALSAGLLAGVIAGLIGFRRRRATRNRVLALGAAGAMALAALWHGPLGGAARFSASVESGARQALEYYEMTAVTAHLQQRPLTRRLILAGPADDFQHSELVRVMSQLPGVSRATWSRNDAGVPLLGEGLAASLLGFLVGLLLAYLVELHRRYNSQWRW